MSKLHSGELSGLNREDETGDIGEAPLAPHVGEGALHLVVPGFRFLDDSGNLSLVENVPDRHRPHPFDDLEERIMPHAHLGFRGGLGRLSFEMVDFVGHAAYRFAAIFEAYLGSKFFR